MNFEDESEWTQLSPEEKKKQLYLKQVETLNGFLERNAISKEQYEKSLPDLTEKMGTSIPNSAVKNSTLFLKQPNTFLYKRPKPAYVADGFGALCRSVKNLCNLAKN